MNKDRFLFILGVLDHSMSRIGSMLTALGIPYLMAKYADELVVSEYSAYRSTRPRRFITDMAKHIVWIKCGLNSPYVLDGAHTIHTIDPSIEGNYGYQLSVGNYFHASSIGQVINYLLYHGDAELIASVNQYLEKNELSLRQIAAAEYCLCQAYRGNCQRVDPGNLRLMRARYIAGRDNLDVNEVITKQNTAVNALKDLQTVKFENIHIYDARTLQLAYIDEALVISGICAVCRCGTKIKLYNALPVKLTEWVNWAKSTLTNVKVNAVDGYAEATLHR